MDSTTARVWIGAKGRRYLTKAGAAHSLARASWNKKHPCECERPRGDYPGYICEDHTNPSHMMDAIDRLARWIRKGARHGNK